MRRRPTWETRVSYNEVIQLNLEIVAKLRMTDAMNEVAWCYLEGFGCKKDKVRKHKKKGTMRFGGASVFSSLSVWLSI